MALVYHMKNDPLFGSKRTFLSDRFNQRTCNRFLCFLVRARSFSHFLHGFFDLFCIFMFVLFSAVPRSVWLESCLEICVAQALFAKIFLQMVAAIVLENVTFFRHEKFF